MRGRTFKGGIHPGDFKQLTEDRSIQTVQTPTEVRIPLSQHIGAPCDPLVSKGDRVLVGQKIGDTAAKVAAPVHSSVSGTVKAVVPMEMPGGRVSQVVVIDNDGEYTLSDEVKPLPDPSAMQPADVIQRVRDAGIVGMGGATFPTHIKLAVPPGKSVDALIINGVECEPYLTSDHRLMVEQPERVIFGVRILMRALSVSRAFIGIEDNKPDAIRVLTEAASGFSEITVVSLTVKYPQGAEKQLIKAVLGREVPSGGLPADVGAVVVNVGTSAAVSDAFLQGMPLVSRVVTVTGPILRNPQNLLVRIGTPVSSLVEACGGLTDELGKLILGGPMMGIAHHSLEVPVTKGTSGILLFSRADAKAFEPTACLRCGKCVSACPMGLMPTALAEMVENGDYDGADRDHILDCIECGSCAYICPANRRIVQVVRQGKNEVMRRRRQRQAG